MNQGETLEAWAKFVVERWERKVSDLNVVDTGELLRSFSAHVYVDARGVGEKIMFAFAYYGRFSELGVGKYAPIGTESTRKKKPWYTKVFFGQVNRLAEIMAEKYGQKAIGGIVEVINS